MNFPGYGPALELPGAELVELRRYREETERLRIELAHVLFPGDNGPASPTLDDLVSYTRTIIQDLMEMKRG